MSNIRDDAANEFRLLDGGRAQSSAALLRGQLVGDQPDAVGALAGARLDDLDSADRARADRAPTASG